MAQIFGDFSEQLPTSQECLVIGFSPRSLPLKKRWRNNGLSADFMADYLTTFFPDTEEENERVGLRAEIRSAVSFIANELLENSMKYSDEEYPHTISLALHLHPNQLVFFARNAVCSQQLDKLQAFICELLASDPQEFLVRQLEKNAEDSSREASGLGYLTMINDYTAKVGWKFEPLSANPAAIEVTTMVQLSV